jgi:hypothetical protein
MSEHGGPDPSKLTRVEFALEPFREVLRLLPTGKPAPSLLAFITKKPDENFETDAPKIDGLGHFITAPQKTEERSMLDGKDPNATPENTAKQRDLMSCLAERMDQPFAHWTPLPAEEVSKYLQEDPAKPAPAPELDENPNLPAGYTYLLQLVAHDVVQTSLAISILEDATTGVHNARRSVLRLDTIYGDGPGACPFAYALDDSPDDASKEGTRTKLRLGRMGPAGVNGPFRDIARTYANNFPPIADAKAKLTEPLIADPRNDDHAILAQMTALFHHLHNGILGKLPKREDKIMADSYTEAAFDRYLCARQAVTLIYRNVVRHDVLPRILHGKVSKAYRAYGADSSKYIDPVKHDRPIPLEFTHAAFRFAHAMVRSKYRINDEHAEFPLFEILRQTSSRSPSQMPLDKPWIVKWSNFFKLIQTDGHRPLLSRRIGPSFTSLLGVFDQFDTTHSKRLAYRDLMSGSFAGLWSVKGLIEKIKSTHSHLVELSPLLMDEDKRAEWIAECLTGTKKPAIGTPAGPLSGKEVGALSKDPPLFLFILCEAAHNETAGLRLGVLGSVIVAETLYGSLNLDPLPAEVNSNGLEQSLANLCRRIYGKANEDRLKEASHIKDMGELIKYTARVADLEDKLPPFL